MARNELEEWFWQFDADYRSVRGGRTRVKRSFAQGSGWEPRVDLIEDALRFIVRAELAGVAPEDVQVVYLPDRHTILLHGCRHEPACTNAATGVYQLEILLGDFSREVPLPSTPIDPEKIQAVFQNGILIVYVPKAPERMTFTRVTVRNV